MSHSPTQNSLEGRGAYETGWVAIHRMLRQGLSWSGRERHVCFLNLQDGRFADVSRASGLDFLDDGRAVARLDWDGDGVPELALTSRGSPRLRLMRARDAALQRWYAFELEGTRTNRDAVGARLELELADGPPIVRGVRSGEGYLAQSTRRLHVALPPEAELASVHVRWPGGARERFEGVEGPARYALREGEGATRGTPHGAPARELAAGAAAEDPGPPDARVALAHPIPLPVLECTDRDGEPVPWLGPETMPRLIVLWADWCAPCHAELRAFAAAAEALDAAGLNLLALDVDPEHPGDLLERIAWPHASAQAGTEALETLELLQTALLDRERELALPCAFLVDGRGRLTHMYRGPVDVAVVLADLSRQDGSDAELLAGAVPFPGRWIAPPTGPDLGRLARLAAERGLERVAQHFERSAYRSAERSEAQVLLRMGNVHAQQGDLARAAELFARAARAEPGLVAAWSSLGAALHQSGRPGESVTAYRRALALDGRDGSTRYNLALARVALGDAGGARDELRSLELISPELAAELAALLRAQGILEPGND